MSSSPGPRSSDDVALRDLVVGEPALDRVLDGEAARARAEQLVRDVGSDPRVAEVVGRIGDQASSQPDLANHLDPSVRESAPEASEIQRPTQRLPASKQVTAPKLDVSGLAHGGDPHANDPHRRVTDPRLHQRGPEDDAADEAYLAAQKALHESARRAKTDHQRLAVLGASALAVGIILLALVLSGKDKPKPAPTAEPVPSGPIPIDTSPVEPRPAETVLSSPTAPVITPVPPNPGSATTPPTSPPTSSPPGSTSPTNPPQGTGVETNPKSSAPKPRPSQDAPVPVPSPEPKSSSDRPF